MGSVPVGVERHLKVASVKSRGLRINPLRVHAFAVAIGPVAADTETPVEHFPAFGISSDTVNVARLRCDAGRTEQTDQVS